MGSVIYLPALWKSISFYLKAWLTNVCLLTWNLAWKYNSQSRKWEDLRGVGWEIKTVVTQPNPIHTSVPYRCPWSNSKKYQMFFRSHLENLYPHVIFFTPFSKGASSSLFLGIPWKAHNAIAFIGWTFIHFNHVDFMLPTLQSEKLKFFNKWRIPSFYSTIILLILVLIKQKEIEVFKIL